MAKKHEGLFKIGNTASCKKWRTPEDLQSDIDAYFDWCIKNPIEITHTSQLDKKTGKPLVYEIKRPFTIEGLCSFLECERMTLINYEKQDGYESYFDTIKKAKNKIQQDKVERGITGTGTASVIIFDLKNNHGYKDRQEIEGNFNTTETKIVVQSEEDKTAIEKMQEKLNEDNEDV